MAEGRTRLMSVPRLLGAAALAFVTALQIYFAAGLEVSWRDNWWDALQRAMPRDRGDPEKAPAVVIAIDEETMKRTQRWPWPRDQLAELLRALTGHGVKVVAFDIFLDERDPQSPSVLSRRYRARGMPVVASSLARLEDSDITLSRAFNESREAGTEVVLPVPGVPEFEGVNATVECRFDKPIILSDPPSAMDGLGPGLASADAPIQVYREAGIHPAAVDFVASSDFVVRRLQAVQRICGAPFLILGAEAMRLASAGFFTKVTRNWAGLEIWLDEPSNPGAIGFPVERDGSFWLHYGQVGDVDDKGQHILPRYISAHEVMAPEFDAARLAGKIALVAVIDLGRIDERRSPLGQIIYGVETHLQMIEQVASGTYLRRPWFMPWVETLILVVAGLLVLIFVPTARPARSTFAILGAGAVMIVVSALTFRMGVLVDMVTPVLGFIIVSGGVVSATLIDRDRQRLRAGLQLAKEQAGRSFLQGELDAAARIQQALLPAARFQRPGLVDLACYIKPARTVGGDFYDHVLIDDQHLFFLVADVSGKGADASQFMLLSKTLWKSVALRTGAPLDRIQIEANTEITRENAATMFVTGLCGLLEMETGRLSYSAAGHDLPFLFREGTPPQQLPDFSGPPAGLVDGAEFPVGHVDLKPGDRLCLFTDGLTEAMRADGTFWGLAGLEKTLASVPIGLDSAGVVDHVVRAVDAFTSGAEQSDDQTLMVITLPG